MSKNNNRSRQKIASRFDDGFEFPWEHAFNKFGFGDGAYSLTYTVVDALEEGGYIAESAPWGIHNETITSIKKNGQEFMPNDDNFTLGYDDPRDYLHLEVIQYLDEYFYGL